MKTLVNPREIWRREDEDFSPWLAENLNLLDEILDTQLDLVGLERPVGPFFADILCLNRVDNSHVVIENQLERSDHKHLGQLLTYATGLQAHTIIWIATEFETEHRNTLEWLNDNMKNHFRFFGVELALRAIDNSDCIPKFTLIAKPRNRSHPQEEHSKNWQEQYYSKFVNYLTDKRSLLVPMTWDQNHPDYLGFYVGEDPKIWLAACLHAKRKWIAVNLHMKQEYAKSHFDKLRECKTDIERTVGRSLEWKREPPHLRHRPAKDNIPQVGLFKCEIDPTNKGNWPDQFDWLCKTLEKLDKTFREHVVRLSSPF